ncbi:hypothetical protein G7Y79_00057g090860 [Physcia stellaris]|nr:hypothetical protein G7Y79_00057g090860 [Physcia stellaris]
MAVVETSMQFLARDKLYEHEKPYRLQYKAPEGVPKTNFRIEKHDRINISSIRGREKEFSLEKNGFTMLNLDQEVPYEDFDNEVGIQRYMNLVADRLRVLLNADKVQVYQYVVGPMPKRDLGFPVAEEGKVYEFNQPSTVAHIDASPEAALSIFEQVNGDSPTKNPNIRFQIVNAWKPLRGPLRDWPLALCDPASVQPDHLVAADLVFETNVAENLQVHHDEAYKWYYLQDQQASELLVFKQADSRSEGQVCVPHSSFPNPLAGPDEPLRESIEVRTLVSYGCA